MQLVLDTVAQEFGLPKEKIQSGRKETGDVADARAVMAYMLRPYFLGQKAYRLVRFLNLTHAALSIGRKRASERPHLIDFIKRNNHLLQQKSTAA